MDAKVVDHSLLCLWYAGAAAELVCFSLLAWRRLLRKYPVLSAYLLIAPIKTAFLVWQNHAFGYEARWHWGQHLAWIDLALYSLLVIEGIAVMARHWKRIFWVAAVLTAVVLLISGAATWITAFIGVPRASKMPYACLILRYHATVLFFCLLAIRGFFGLVSSIPMRANVQTYSGLLILLLASQIVGAGVWYMGDWWQRAAANAINLGTSLLCCVFWSLELKPAGEAYTPPPAPDPAALRHLKEEQRELLEELREALGFPR